MFRRFIFKSFLIRVLTAFETLEEKRLPRCHTKKSLGSISSFHFSIHTKFSSNVDFYLTFSHLTEFFVQNFLQLFFRLKVLFIL